MNQILYTTTDRNNKVVKRMHSYIQQAINVGPNSKLDDLQYARQNINIAKGMFFTLYGLGLIDTGYTAEDIDRAENKILYLIEQRKRPQDGNPKGPYVKSQFYSKSNWEVCQDE